MKSVLTLALLCAVTVPAHAEVDQAASALIRAHNERDIGAQGWRRVKLELSTKGVVTRTLLVSNVWNTTEGGVRTLFALEAPDGLRGICYLLDEAPANRRFMRVHLFMPVGAKKLLEIASTLEEQSLLGSDFTYRDLTWRIPEAGYTARITGSGTSLGEEVTYVELVANTTGDVWPRRRFAIARSSLLILAIDFYRARATTPDKTYRVDRFEHRDGVATPTRITIVRGETASVLSLDKAAFGLASVGELLLAPEGLAATAERIRAGATVEQLIGLPASRK